MCVRIGFSQSYTIYYYMLLLYISCVCIYIDEKTTSTYKVLTFEQHVCYSRSKLFRYIKLRKMCCNIYNNIIRHRTHNIIIISARRVFVIDRSIHEHNISSPRKLPCNGYIIISTTVSRGQKLYINFSQNRRFMVVRVGWTWDDFIIEQNITTYEPRSIFFFDISMYLTSIYIYTLIHNVRWFIDIRWYTSNKLPNWK